MRRNLPCIMWPLNRWFEYFIFASILGSILLLITDSPNDDPASPTRQSLARADFVFSTIFIIEALLRILAEGFLTSSLPGRKGYIRVG